MKLSRYVLLVVISLTWAQSASAELNLCNLFTDHMVLQRGQNCRVWGWDTPGTKVSVSINGQNHQATADGNGAWEVKLNPMKAGGPHTLTIAGSSTKEIQDVLVGEVWVCSGQSNMQWPVSNANDPDLEKMAANFPKIRLVTVPQVGTQELQNNFNGAWKTCSPDSVMDFSAVGYFFGRQLHQTLDVPIGLIDNAWGGSSAEAWLRRDVLEQDGRFDDLMKRWKQTEATYDHEKSMEAYEQRLAKWKEARKAAIDAGKTPPNAPRRPRNPLVGQHRPGNLFAGCLNPIVGYTIKGAIWYQGESNSGRAYQYRDLFPLMISHWRDVWQQGDFSFYWVQLADFRREVAEPGDSTWAELREAQTMSLSLPNTGQAVITDLGEADDIHPKNKQDVAKRLARHAFAKDYGLSIVAESPRYKSMTKQGNKIVVDFDHVGGGLDTFDVRDLIGFTIAGEDKKFAPAMAKIVPGNKIEVWSEAVEAPVAVRYAWADNPVCNVQNREGLPLTPFRTDDWKGITEGINQ